MTAEPDPTCLAFGDFVLDRANRELRHNGRRIDLGSRYFDALALLAGEPGMLIPKERFMDRVWRGVPVTDEALTQCIRSLRRALGDSASAPRFIATVPKHGYRFDAPVVVCERVAPIAPGTAARAGGGRSVGAVALGGAAAGAGGGLLYGVLAGGGGATPLVLAVLGASLGLIGAAGIATGMALAANWRPQRPGWMVAGAVMGGGLVGALGDIVSHDGVAVLTGAALGPVAGVFEGAVLGLAVAAGRFQQRRAWAGWLAGGAAGLAIALSGGRLFASSLVELQRRVPGSGLALDRLGHLFGESGFGQVTSLVTAAGEGALFVGAILMAQAAAERRVRR